MTKSSFNFYVENQTKECYKGRKEKIDNSI